MRQHIQIILAALLVLILGYVGYSLLFVGDEDVSLVILEARGDVRRADAQGHALPAEPGMEMAADDRLSTGLEGHAVLAVGDEAQIRLDRSSTVRVLGVDNTGVRVELEGGRVQARVRPGAPALGVSSRGRGVLATDADFTMGVDEEGGLTVDASRGVLALQGFDETVQLEAGLRLRSIPGRNAVVGDVPRELLLEVAWPEASTTRAAELALEGHTEPYAQVSLGSDEASARIRAGPDGRFVATVPLREGDNAIEVWVSDPMGNEREDRRGIVRDSTAPSVTSTEVLWGG